MRSHDSGRIEKTDRREALRITVFGGGSEGREIALRLAEDGVNVSYYDERTSLLRPAADEGITTGLVTLDDRDSLACTNAAEADVVVVAGRSDRRNLLLTQLLRTGIGVDEVLLRVNRSANVDAFDAIGVHTVHPTGDVVEEMNQALDSIVEGMGPA